MTQHQAAVKSARNEEATAHLAAIVDSSDDAILSRTLDGVITSWNQGAERLYGYTAAQAVGRPISILVPADRMDELQLFKEKIERGEKIKNFDTVRLAKEGREVQVSLTLSPIHGADGALTGISIIARDNSDRMRMERLLRESETRYRVLVEMAPDAFFVHHDGHFVYANCAALGCYGVSTLETLQQHTFFELAHPEDRDAMRASIDRLLSGELVSLLEYRLLRPDGEELVVESSSSLVEYQGSPSVQVIARDITERKRSEREREAMLKELDYERSRFETVVRQLPVGLLIAEAPSGRLVYHNEQSLMIFRLAKENIASFGDYRQWELYRLDGSRLPMEEMPLVRAVTKGEPVIGEELRILRGDGTVGYVCVNATPIRGGSGEVVSALAALSDITESKEAAQALSKSEERLKLALDAAEMGSCDMDAQSGKGIWSRSHFDLLGYDFAGGERGAASIRMWHERIHRDDLDEVLRALDEARSRRTLFRSEHRIVRADNGRTVWVNVLGRFICEQSGERCRFIGVIFDVSRRREAEDAVRLSAQRFRRMSDAMPQIVWTAEPDGTVDYLNAHFENYTGIDREAEADRLSTPLRILPDLIHPDDVQKTAKAWLHSIATGETYQHENRIKDRNGAYRWHLSRATAERDERGRVVKWYGTATDIHDLREMQEKLQQSETRFRWLYESNLVAIFFWKKDGGITEANQAYCDLVGYSAEECRQGGLNWQEITAPEYHDKDISAIREMMSSGICRAYEKVFINRKSGERVAVLTALASMVDPQAEGIGFAVDLTDQKRAEQALKDSEATLKLAVETTGLGIFTLDLATGKGDWSSIAKGHYGLPPEAEVDLETALDAMHPEDRPRMERLVRDAATPGSAGFFSAQYRTVGVSDGKLRWISMRARVSHDEAHRPSRLVGACMNITDIVLAQEALKEEMTERVRAVEELRRQEQLLIRQGRLAAMGEMIANIAHQWRQPLNTLGLIIQELPTYYDRDLLSREYLDGSVSRAMQVINYMSQTIDGFRNFFGPGKEKQNFLAGEVLERTVAILDAAFAELKLELEVHLDREAVVYGTPNEYSHVILNILMNAKDALLERKVANPKVVVRLFREGGRAVVTITDNAGGIPPEIFDRIFDPYFTTKGPEKGTGIGLFMSKTIIEKSMNGRLTVANTDEGAQFRIEV